MLARKVSLKKLDDSQLSYLAGYLDSRGTLMCQKILQKRGKNPSFVPLYSVGDSRCPARLELLSRWTGVPIVHNDDKRSSRFRVQLSKTATVAMLEVIQPFLIHRKEESKLILGIEKVRASHHPDGLKDAKNLSLPDNAISKMDSLWGKLQVVKAQRRKPKNERLYA